MANVVCGGHAGPPGGNACDCCRNPRIHGQSFSRPRHRNRLDGTLTPIFRKILRKIGGGLGRLRYFSPGVTKVTPQKYLKRPNPPPIFRIILRKKGSGSHPGDSGVILEAAPIKRVEGCARECAPGCAHTVACLPAGLPTMKGDTQTLKYIWWQKVS